MNGEPDVKSSMKNAQPSEDLKPQGLPEYAALLAARHTAHESELRGVLQELFGGFEGAILDVACGDGFYTSLISQIAGSNASVTAIDLSSDFLVWAASAAPRGNSSSGNDNIVFVAADAERLPFADESFDAVWCAQSLISLPEPIAALREMRRVVRCGGMVALLENDRLHEMQLPFSPELELELRQAERRVEDSEDSDDKAFAGRRLEDLLLQAGLAVKQRKTLSIDRQAPLSSADEAFIQTYLHALLERTQGLMDPRFWDELKRLSTPGTADYLPSRPGFWMTWTDVVVISTRE